MDRTNGTNNDTNAFGSGKHGYKTSAPFTSLTPAAMNAIQEEIARVIEGFGVTLNGASFTQLFDAITGPGRQDVNQPNAASATFGSQSKPNTHPGSAANIWKEFVTGQTNAGAYIRFLIGDGGTNGDWAITYNAQWDPASGAQQWHADNTGQPSSMIMSANAKLFFLRRNAGAGTWTTWPNGGDFELSGNMDVDGNLNVDGTAALPNISGSTVVAGGLTAATLDATGDVFAGDDVIATGEFQYGTPPTRTKSINLCEGVGGTPDGAGQPRNLAPGELLAVAVRAPAGATLGQVRVKIGLPGLTSVATVRLFLFKRNAANFGGGNTIPTTTQVDTIGNTLLTTNQTTDFTAMTFGGLTVDKDETYWVTVVNDSGSIDSVRVQAEDFSFVDPGPRNH